MRIVWGRIGRILIPFRDEVVMDDGDWAIYCMASARDTGGIGVGFESISCSLQCIMSPPLAQVCFPRWL